MFGETVLIPGLRQFWGLPTFVELYKKNARIIPKRSFRLKVLLCRLLRKSSEKRGCAATQRRRISTPRQLGHRHVKTCVDTPTLKSCFVHVIHESIYSPSLTDRQARTAKVTDKPASFVCVVESFTSFVVLAKPTSSFLSLLMATKTDSDIESDEEFEDVVEQMSSWPHSDSLDTYVKQFRNQFSKNRLDRVDTVFSIMGNRLYRTRPNFFWISLLKTAAFDYMTAEGCSDSIRWLLRHFGGTISKRQMKSMVMSAALHRDTGSLQLLRETYGKSFVEETIEDFRNGHCVLRSRLLWVSEHGDPADFEGLLTPTVETKASHDNHRRFDSCVDVIEKIAELGRVNLVEALLVELQSKDRDAVVDIDCVHQKLFHVACRKDDFALASSMLSAMCSSWNQGEMPPVFTTMLNDNALCTAEFLEKFLLWMRASLAKDGQEMSPDWFKEMVCNAIELRRPSHLKVLLNEIDRIGNPFDFQWFVPAVLDPKSAAILRLVLLRYPEASIEDTGFDPVQVLQSHCWPVGARMLVEAGATARSNIPSEHAEIFKLSLEDKCRIVARRNIQHPLVQNVQHLPLPSCVKRRLLYRWPRKNA